MDSRLLTSSSSSGGMGMEGTCPKEIFKLKKKKVDSGLTEYYISRFPDVRLVDINVVSVYKLVGNNITILLDNNFMEALESNEIPILKGLGKDFPLRRPEVYDVDLENAPLSGELPSSPPFNTPDVVNELEIMYGTPSTKKCQLSRLAARKALSTPKYSSPIRVPVTFDSGVSEYPKVPNNVGKAGHSIENVQRDEEGGHFENILLQLPVDIDGKRRSSSGRVLKLKKAFEIPEIEPKRHRFPGCPFRSHSTPLDSESSKGFLSNSVSKIAEKKIEKEYPFQQTVKSNAACETETEVAEIIAIQKNLERLKESEPELIDLCTDDECSQENHALSPVNAQKQDDEAGFGEIVDLLSDLSPQKTNIECIEPEAVIAVIEEELPVIPATAIPEELDDQVLGPSTVEAMVQTELEKIICEVGDEDLYESVNSLSPSVDDFSETSMEADDEWEQETSSESDIMESIEKVLFSTEFQETDLPHPISIPPQNPVNGEDFVYAELPPGHEAKAEASVFKGSMVSPTVLETFPHWTLAGESQDLLGGLDFSDLIRIEENEDEAGFRVSFEKIAREVLGIDNEHSIEREKLKSNTEDGFASNPENAQNECQKSHPPTLVFGTDLMQGKFYLVSREGYPLKMVQYNGHGFDTVDEKMFTKLLNDPIVPDVESLPRTQ